MEFSLPIYLHPTLIILIDDSGTFLESLVFQLHRRLPCKVFQDPREAVQWLRDTYLHAAPPAPPLTVDYDEQILSFERRVVAIDIEQIYRQVMNPYRFLLPAVLVIDYAMPQMNGVKFCESVQDLSCKKILFTGQADETIAIAAFNQGLIDRFIKKGAPTALTQLEAEIHDLQHAFFQDQSRTVKDLLVRHSYAFLSDPAIGVLVAGLCEQYDFVEYYLFPNPGGVLFFDLQGSPTLMVVETEGGMLSHFEAARDGGAPAELLTALREMRMLPFFSETGLYTDAIAHDWLSYCLPANHCKGQQDYYWALFDLPTHYLPGPIYSFADFLREHAQD